MKIFIVALLLLCSLILASCALESKPSPIQLQIDELSSRIAVAENNQAKYVRPEELNNKLSGYVTVEQLKTTEKQVAELKEQFIQYSKLKEQVITLQDQINTLNQENDKLKETNKMWMDIAIARTQ